MAQPIQKALIYCRISSNKQQEGSGLSSQRHRCTTHCANKGHFVEKIFTDIVSGGVNYTERKGMMSLLQHIKRNKNTNYVVVFDDLKRLARDTRYYLKLISEFEKFNVKIECLNYHFDPSPEGRFVETIHAAQGQLEREQGGRQSLQKSRARMEQGYYVFRATGYKYIKAKGGGKLLVRDEPVASILSEALNGFASGRFQTQMEIKEFLDTFPEYPKGGNGTVAIQRIRTLLTRPLYAGIIEYEPWGILCKGQHEPLTSIENYQRIQEILHGKARVPIRKDLNTQFPLRGFVLCECEAPLTACFSKGQFKSYPYYLCHNKECEFYGKSIRRDDIENAFEKLLHSLTPSKELFNKSKRMLDNIWKFRTGYQKKRASMLNVQLIEVDRKIEKLIDLIIDSPSASTTKNYERRMNNLEKEKMLYQEKIANCARPLADYDETYRTVERFLAAPHVLWSSERLEDKKAVLKLVFADNLTWVRKSGLRTPKITLPFKMLGDFSALKTLERKMVQLNGDLSNQFFDKMAEWNAILEDTSVNEFPEPT